jgi:hypothetical protein
MDSSVVIRWVIVVKVASILSVLGLAWAWYHGRLASDPHEISDATDDHHQIGRSDEGSTEVVERLLNQKRRSGR